MGAAVVASHIIFIIVLTWAIVVMLWQYFLCARSGVNRWTNLVVIRSDVVVLLYSRLWHNA